MKEIDFINWLDGFLILSVAKTLNENQVQEIKNHIELVKSKRDFNLSEQTLNNQEYCARTIKMEEIKEFSETLADSMLIDSKFTLYTC